MRLTFITQAAAQTRANEIHAWMQSSNAEYAASVKAGRTTAVAIPYQDKDTNGKVVGTSWYLNLKDRHLGALTAQEKA